jgi:hypothetical protein
LFAAAKVVGQAAGLARSDTELEPRDRELRFQDYAARSIDFLHQALEAGYESAANLTDIPEFEVIKNLPEFTAIAER